LVKKQSKHDNMIKLLLSMGNTTSAARLCMVRALLCAARGEPCPRHAACQRLRGKAEKAL
jgi:hypothetical protein